MQEIIDYINEARHKITKNAIANVLQSLGLLDVDWQQKDRPRASEIPRKRKRTTSAVASPRSQPPQNYSAPSALCNYQEILSLAWTTGFISDRDNHKFIGILAGKTPKQVGNYLKNQKFKRKSQPPKWDASNCDQMAKKTAPNTKILETAWNCEIILDVKSHPFLGCASGKTRKQVATWLKNRKFRAKKESLASSSFSSGRSQSVGGIRASAPSPSLIKTPSTTPPKKKKRPVKTVRARIVKTQQANGVSSLNETFGGSSYFSSFSPPGKRKSGLRAAQSIKKIYAMEDESEDEEEQFEESDEDVEEDESEFELEDCDDDEDDDDDDVVDDDDASESSEDFSEPKHLPQVQVQLTPTKRGFKSMMETKGREATGDEDSDSAVDEESLFQTGLTDDTQTKKLKFLPTETPRDDTQSYSLPLSAPLSNVAVPPMPPLIVGPPPCLLSSTDFNEMTVGNEEDAEMVPPEGIVCVCETEFDPTKYMMLCDVCEQWFHGSCVEITEKMSENLESWICPKCSK